MKHAWSRLLRTDLGRDVAIAIGLIAIIAAILIFGGGSANGQRDSGPSISTAYLNPQANVEATIPDGWRALRRSINAVLYPPQVLAAASFPVTVPREPRSCHPGEVLHQMPADGVLLQVFEYTPHNSVGKPVRVPHLPPRPSRFRYRDAAYGPFECAGLSYKFTFEQDGRAFQAHVWFERRTVDPALRAQALRILNSFHPTGRQEAG